MTFQLDTTGRVEFSPWYVSASGAHLAELIWGDLDGFTQGYIEALLSEPETARAWWLRHSGPFGVPAAAPFRDLAPETLERIIADCEAFQASPAHDHGGDRKAKGAALWKARNAIPDLGTPRYWFPPLTVQLGDDGKVRFAA